MKRVLLCTNTFQNPCNGPTRFANIFLESGEKQNFFEPYILSEDIHQMGRNKFILAIPTILRRSIFSQLFRNYFYFSEIKRLNAIYHFDAVLFNNCNTGILTALLLRVRSFGFINDSLNAEFNIYQRPNSEYFHRCYQLLLERIAVYSFKSIVVNSEFLKDQIINRYGICEAKVTRVYKAVDFTHFSTTGWNRYYNGGTSVDILFVKTDYLRGGLLDLIKACNHLKGFSFTLHIVGSKALDRLDWSQIQVNENISLILHGTIDQIHLISLMHRCNVFCTPSRTEALGVANIEALALGMPVVSTHVGGIVEVLDYGKRGKVSSS